MWNGKFSILQLWFKWIEISHLFEKKNLTLFNPQSTYAEYTILKRNLIVEVDRVLIFSFNVLIILLLLLFPPPYYIIIYQINQ